MTGVLQEREQDAASLDRPGSAEPVRCWAAVLLMALLALPWAGLRLLDGTTEPLLAVLLAGLAILGAAFLLAWSAEALQLDVSQALALGLLAQAVAILYLLLSMLFVLRSRQVRQGVLGLPSLARLALRAPSRTNGQQGKDGAATDGGLRQDAFVRVAGRGATPGNRRLP